MDKLVLESLVEKAKSTRNIAKKVGLSQSTIRYWLKKYKLKTKYKNNKIPKIYLCGKCGETDQSKFYGRKNRTCGKCHNKYTLRRGQENKLKGIEYLGGKCKLCNYDKYSGSLDFHHTDPKEKDKNFHSIRGWSWDRMKLELDKCELLCKNCHSEIHAKI